jgi:single-strand DNA-binding protein
MYEQIILIGHLGSDPELRETPTGVPCASFRMAVNRRWTTNDGQTQVKTNWYTITTWRRTAELTKQYLAKGRQVMIVGEISGARAYKDRDGNLAATIDVTARDLRFMDARRDEHDIAGMASGEQPEAVEDKIPF